MLRAYFDVEGRHAEAYSRMSGSSFHVLKSEGARRVIFRTPQVSKRARGPNLLVRCLSPSSRHLQWVTFPVYSDVLSATVQGWNSYTYNLLEIKERPLLWRKMSWAAECLRKRWAEITKYFESTFAVADHCSITFRRCLSATDGNCRNVLSAFENRLRVGLV